MDKTFTLTVDIATRDKSFKKVEMAFYPLFSCRYACRFNETAEQFIFVLLTEKKQDPVKMGVDDLCTRCPKNVCF